MKILVTGSAGHLGEALIRTLQQDFPDEHTVVGVDILTSPFTDKVGNLVDRTFVDNCFVEEDGFDVVFHTATLHKPHIATHTKQDFVDTNISATLNLLEASVVKKEGRDPARAFIFTSSTSTYGDAMAPSKNPDDPTVWITEDETVPIPKNVYGVTKIAAENMCQLFHRNHGLSCMVLKTSRFFPEADDNAKTRLEYSDDNAKANEFLYRRIDVEDVVGAHLQAMNRAVGSSSTTMTADGTIKASLPAFGKYIISATPPFTRKDHAHRLRTDAPAVIQEVCPEYAEEYRRRGWKMFPSLDRVYDNQKARRALNWEPKHTFASLVARLKADQPLLSTLAYQIGQKGYHSNRIFSKEGDGAPYPVEGDES